MSSISVYINFNEKMKENVLLSLKSHSGYVLEVSDVLNIILYRTHPKDVDRIIKIKGVTIVTDKFGRYVEH